MTILVLICALAVAAPDCQPDTAIHSFYAPDPQPNLVGCFREGMMYASQSGLVQQGTYSKVLCIERRTTVTLTTEQRLPQER